MSVSVEITSPLGRRLAITVPAEKIEKFIQARIQQLAKTIKIEGFRAGKVPASVVEQRYGKAVRGEAVEELLQSSLKDALVQEGLLPIDAPAVTSLKAEPGAAMEYSVTFEVFPEINLRNLNDVTLEKLAVDISDADINQTLEQIRKLHVLWEPVQRPAELGDRLTVDMQGLVDNQPLIGQKDEGIFLVLEQGVLPEDFMALKGTKAGDEIVVNLPANAAAAQRATQVQIKIHEVSAPKLPDVDESFAKLLGVADGSVEGLRNEVRKYMEQHIAGTVKDHLKAQLTQTLLERHSFELPKQLIDAERKHIEQEIRANAQQAGQNVGTLTDADQEKCLEMARRRVTLQLLFSALVREHNIKVDEQRVMTNLKQLYDMFDNNQHGMDKNLLNNKEFLANIRNRVLEDQLIEKLLSQVQFTEKSMPYTEVMNIQNKAPGQIMHDHHDHDGHNCSAHGHDHGHHHPSSAPIR